MHTGPGCPGCRGDTAGGAWRGVGTPRVPRGRSGGAEGSPRVAAWPFPCEVEAGVFEVPAGYTVLGAGRSEPLRDEDDDLLQFAIQQSLLDAGTETDQVRPRPPPAHLDAPHGHLDTALTCGHAPQVTIWEALTNTRPGAEPPPYDEDLQLER